MAQATLLGFARPECKSCRVEMNLVGGYTKQKADRKSVITLFKCPVCTGTLKEETSA